MQPLPSHNPLAPTPRTERWFWHLPLLAIVALISIISFFVWFGLNQEQEERRAALVSDSLWMEQNLRYQFESTEILLAQIGTDFDNKGALSSEHTTDKAHELLQSSTGLTAILWLNAKGSILTTLPASAAPVSLPEEHLTSVLRSRAWNRPSYTQPFPQPDGTHAIEVILPIFEADDIKGYVIGIFSLPSLIRSHIPWWFAERYRLSFTNEDGQEIASTSRATAQNEIKTFSVSFDRMGGLGIRISAYRATTRIIPAIVVIVLIAFTLIISWSLWMLRVRVLRLQETESALRSEHAFRLAIENSTLIGLRARDMEGRITDVNAAFCRMVGWDSEELIGLQKPMPFWLADSPEPGSTPQNADNAQAIEMRFQRKSGEVFDVLIYEAPLIDAKGQQAGWMGSVLDITERKRAEALARSQQEQLEATARLVTMGEMASTLAHELNQPLSAIASYSAGCLNALKAGRYEEKQFTDILSKINHQAQRAGRIIHRIYGFVRRSESRRERMDVNAAILEATGLLEAELLRRKVRLQLDLSAELPPVIGDRTMVEQVMVNLLRNGMDAMLSTEEAERSLHVSSAAVSNSVRLCVTDHGTGIPPDIADKLFDSFFTTKPDGMGMGLKICRSVAEQHNGRLWFEAVPSGGTRFFLQLPISADELSA